MILEENGMLWQGGSIVDAVIIEAPSSTKNSGKSRDPEMKQTKKGNAWHFGMKAHVGADAVTTILITRSWSWSSNKDIPSRSLSRLSSYGTLIRIT